MQYRTINKFYNYAKYSASKIEHFNETKTGKHD